jgi:hypothetical protein
MMYDFQISDANVGQTIGPQDGCLVSLVMQTPPSRYEVPDFNAAAQQYTSGYFVLRGSGDTRNIYCSHCRVRSHFSGDLLNKRLWTPQALDQRQSA